MRFARKIKRNIDRARNGRMTCPKCHAKLVDKSGYGLVCAECGWWKLSEDASPTERGGEADA